MTLVAQPAQHGDERGGYYVFWETENAYGSRGDRLTWDQAMELVRAMETTGDPSASPSDAERS